MRRTEELLGYCDVREMCTLKLPAGPYRGLQYTVDNTTNNSNQILANRADCSGTLTMHEFYAFGTLRSGHRLQWRNIARELIAHILDFSRHETQSFAHSGCMAGWPLQ